MSFCIYGMRCFYSGCQKVHPRGWIPEKNQYCPNKSECTVVDCIHRHPYILCTKGNCDQISCTFVHKCRLEEAGWKCPQTWNDPIYGKIVCRLDHKYFGDEELENDPPNSAIAEFLQIVISTPSPVDSSIVSDLTSVHLDGDVSEVQENDNSDNDQDDVMVSLKNGASWNDY